MIVAASPARPRLTGARLLRSAGTVTIIAGELYALETLLHLPRDIDKLAEIIQQSVLGVSWYVSHTLGIAAGLLGLLGLTGLYVRQFDRMGELGLAGFVVAVVGAAMVVGVLVPDAYIFPVLGRGAETAALLDFPGPFPVFVAFTAASGLMFVLGAVMFSVAGVRGRVLSPWGFILVAVGTPMTTFGSLLSNAVGLVGAVIMGLGYVWLGWELRRDPAGDLLSRAGQQ